jgi:hypothetical protein
MELEILRVEVRMDLCCRAWAVHRMLKMIVIVPLLCRDAMNANIGFDLGLTAILLVMGDSMEQLVILE